jgi:hypothetical protein
MGRVSALPFLSHKRTDMKSDIVYKCPGPHKGPFGTTYTFKAVYSQAEELISITEGWHVTLMQAVNKFKGIEEKEDEIEPIENATLPIELEDEVETIIEKPKTTRPKTKSKSK